MATASNWESFLSPHEVRAYSQFFAAANGGKSNVVQGREAVQFFVRSGIPNEILSDIWETADRDNLGYLTPETFSIALKLIACAQHGHDVSQPILSTVVPLPQFEGFNPDLHPISPNTTGPLDTVSPSDREKYLNIFRAHQPVQGLLDGVKAREIFLKSKLPKDILEQIWNLANVRKSGNLNQTEFVIAMHYIARMMDHTLLALPSHLPASVYGSAAGSISSSPVIRRTTMSPISRHTTGSSTISHMVPLPPPSRVNKVNEITGASPVATEAGVSVFGSNSVSNWYISKHQRQQFDAIFDRLDMHHTGLLPGGEAGNFFKNSRLPEAELARIWDLADSEQRGQLTRHEFAIAMFLIQKRLAGESLPNSLPASLTSNTQNQPAANILTQSAPLQSPPSLGPQTPPTQPLTVQEPLGDLLGDFDNEEQLTETTNAVNQLQYQIKNETSSLDKIKAQKKEMEQQLDQLRDQKEYTNIQKKHLLEAVENEKETLSKLQSAINSEEPDWSSARQDRAVAQSRLNELREELAKMTATLHEKKLETERLRREVHRIQKEKDSYVDDLYRLRQYVKQQEKPALSFDEIFGTPTFEQPQVDQTTLAPQHPDQEDPSYSQDALVNEFDNIFGASYDEPKRQAPPPPPPPHRRVTVRRAEVSPQPVVSSATSSSAVTSSKKHRAPPPPPPSTTAVTASAIVAGAAGASTAVGFQQEQSSEAEADVTTTDDDSEDEIPLSDLKAESARETVSAGFRDISPEDTIPLTPSVKGDAFNTAEAKNDSVNMDMATVTGTEGSQFDMDTNDISSSESTDVKTRESLVETKLRTEDINPRPTEPTEEGFNMVSKSFSSEDATMAVCDAEQEEKSRIEVIKPKEWTALAEKDGSDDRFNSVSQPGAGDVSGTESFIDDDKKPEADSSGSQIGEMQQQDKDEQDATPVEETAKDKPELSDNTTPIIAEQATANLPVTTEGPPAAEAGQVTTEFKAIDPDLAEGKNESFQTADKIPVDGPESVQEQEAAGQKNTSFPAEENTEVNHPERLDDIGKSIEQGDGTFTLPSSVEAPSVVRDIDLGDHKPEHSVNEEVDIQEYSTEDTTVQKSSEINSKPQEPSGDKLETQENIEDNTKIEGPEVERLNMHGPDEEITNVDEVKAKDAEAQKTISDMAPSFKDTADMPTPHEKDNEPEASIQPQTPPIKTTTPSTTEDDDDFQSVVSDGVIAMDESIVGSSEQTPIAQELTPDALSSDQEELGKASEPLHSSRTSEPEDVPLHPEEEASQPPAQQTKNPSNAATAANDPLDIPMVEDVGRFTEGDKTIVARHEPQSLAGDKEQQSDSDGVLMEQPNDKIKAGSASSDSSTGENESFEMVSSNASLEKQKQDDAAVDEFDDAFESELQDAKVVTSVSEAQQLSFDDDFDAAFSSDLMDVKIVSDSKFDPFSSADNIESAEDSNGKAKLNWASSFGGFDFGQDEDDQKTSDEWDAIFGGGGAAPATSAGTSTAATLYKNGFEDSFDSIQLAKPEPSQQEHPQELEPICVPASSRESAAVPEPASAPVSAPESSAEPVTTMFVGSGSNLDQLVAMGFDRALAKDALNRYDQDLEKATNFLLDN